MKKKKKMKQKQIFNFWKFAEDSNDSNHVTGFGLLYNMLLKYYHLYVKIYH